MKQILIILGFIFFMTACSPVSSTWSCKGKTKGGCKTIYEIEQNYDDKVHTRLNLKQEDKKDFSSFEDFRSRESVSRVVFGPYIDSAGNRHDMSTVYYLDQKAEWRN